MVAAAVDVGRAAVATGALALARVMGRRLYRRIAYGLAAAGVASVLVVGGLWWRLASGPISLDLATPWLAAAIAENFGNQHSVEVGGTQIERDEQGRTTLRLQNIVVRARDGTVVASAPKAEVGISGTALLTGGLRAEQLRLVGAELSVRIEKDGHISVFAGADGRPIAAAAPRPAAKRTAQPPSVATPPGAAPLDPAAPPASLSPGGEAFAALLAWIDGLGASGLDGHALLELGLRNGSLIVDDQREGKRWSFQNIDVSLRRPPGGGVEFSVRSDQPDRRWAILAAATPNVAGRRSMRLEARQVPARDLLLALRFADLPFDADLPLSARMRVDIGPAGIPELIEGTIVAQSGFIGERNNPSRRIAVDRAAVNVHWEPTQRMLVMPVQVVASGNRFTVLGQVIPPMRADPAWRFQFGGGSIVLTSKGNPQAPLILNRILVRLRYDPTTQQLDLEQGELGNGDTGLAFSGGIDFASPVPRLTLGMASRPMPVAVFKQLWPAPFAPEVHQWVVDRVSAGTIDSVDVAINMALAALFEDRPLPDGGLSIGIVARDAALQPVGSLPGLRGADLNVRVTGRTAKVTVKQASLKLPSGRTLSVPDGVFHVADTSARPAQSQTQLRVTGTVAAAAELLAMEPLRDVADAPLDPANSRGNVDANVTVGAPLLRNPPPASKTYAAEIDLTNFAAERMIMGHRLEAARLRLTADNRGYWVKGDVKVAGLPAVVELAKKTGEADTAIRLQAVLDEKTRGRLGVNFGSSLIGPLPVRLAGHLGADDRESRLSVEADLTQARLDNVIPGWEKAPGAPARARFTLIKEASGTRFEDLSIDGSGVTVRGDIKFDDSGRVTSADLPVFSLSPGDKSALKAERGSNGTMQVALRGDVYDGRQFLKALTVGSSRDERGRHDHARDLDLDVKIGTVAGFHGETLRGLTMKLSRRGDRIRDFSLKANVGRNATLIGDLRPSRPGRPAIFLETNDAGALFRFTNTYSRVVGGQMTVAMDPPRSDHAPQDGSLSVRNFAVRGEAALDRVVSGAPSTQRNGVEFSSLRVNFTRSPGRLTVRDGVVRGPVLGGTIDGVIDYRADAVRARGVLVPLYGVNNLFGQLPIVGFFLGGGSNEGLLGINYDVVGTPSAPILRVNPLSAVAPGIIRKLIPNLFNVPTDQRPGQAYPPAYSDTSR